MTPIDAAAAHATPARTQDDNRLALSTGSTWPGDRCPDHVFDAHGAPAPLLVRRRPGHGKLPPFQASAAFPPNPRLQPVHRLTDGVLCAVNATAHDNAPQAGLPAGAGELLQAACALAALLPARLKLSMALPPDTGCDSQLVRRVEAALNRADLPAGRLELALDGGALADAGTAAMLSLSALRDFGIGLALDGVDAVPLMLQRLRRLPFTCVRLAPGLLRELSHCRETRTLVAETIRVAHGLGATVSALDVATVLQRDILADLRCDTGMGPVFGMPMEPCVFKAALLHEMAA